MRKLVGALRAALDHQWVSRVSNATWIMGVVIGVAKWATRHVHGWDSAMVAIVLVAVVGLVVNIASVVVRHRHRSQRPVVAGERAAASLAVGVGDSWVASPQSALRAMAVELTITNAGGDRASVDVSFELCMEDGRWSRERPLAPGAVLDGHPHMGVLAVSGSPVAVEARDSYRGWFGVEVGNPRLRTPLDMRVVVRDLLSGATAMAVVSGAADLVTAPLSGVKAPALPSASQGASAASRPDRDVRARDALLREYRAGEQLVAGNQHSPITARMSAASRMTMVPVTTLDAVEQWEKRVVHLLHRAERWELADYFLADVPAPPTPTTEERLASSRALSATVMQVEGPWSPGLGRRLDFRLTQLNTIIKRKL